MSNNDDLPYEVGYKKPPRHSRFRKGESGNPNGRPKGRLNSATVLARTLSESVVVKEHGIRKKTTKHRAVMKQLVNKALAGDVRAIAFITNLYETFLKETAKDSKPQKRSEADREIMERILNRMRNDEETHNEN